jgi:glutamate synthase (NADPH/NADH) small chain
MAIGTRANPLLTSTAPALELNKRGYIDVSSETFATSIPGVYAGGDIVTGSATVIEAMGAGKIAADQMDGFMRSVL